MDGQLTRPTPFDNAGEHVNDEPPRMISWWQIGVGNPARQLPRMLAAERERKPVRIVARLLVITE